MTAPVFILRAKEIGDTISAFVFVEKLENGF